MGNTCGLLVEPDVGSDRGRSECADSTARVSRIQNEGGEYFFLGLLLKKKPDYRTCEHSSTWTKTCPLFVYPSSNVLIVWAWNVHKVPQRTVLPGILSTDQGAEGFS